MICSAFLNLKRQGFPIHSMGCSDFNAGDTFAIMATAFVAIIKGMVLKDFDIRKGAGAFLQALRKEYTTQVLEKYLEIHLFWAGKGTCCVPAPGTYGPAISAMSATPDFKPSVSNNPPTGVSNNSSTGQKNRTWLIVGISMGGGVLIPVMLVSIVFKEEKGPTPVMIKVSQCITEGIELASQSDRSCNFEKKIHFDQS